MDEPTLYLIIDVISFITMVHLIYYVIDELKEILTSLLARTESEEKQETILEAESGDAFEDEEDKPPGMINHFASSQHGEDLDLEVEFVHVNQHS